ncbi:MAG: hypothetical protein KJ604_20050, partial [Gammaproteobacteria bacterium]|nr:hypothetical protein [Gammaproteobacteria bacterium]
TSGSIYTAGGNLSIGDGTNNLGSTAWILNGAGAQSITVDNATDTLDTLTIDKAGGTASTANNITVLCMDVQNGEIDFSGDSIAIQGNFTIAAGGAVTADDETVFDFYGSGYITNSGQPNLALNWLKVAALGSMSAFAGTENWIANKLTVGSGTLAFNSNVAITVNYLDSAAVAIDDAATITGASGGWIYLATTADIYRMRIPKINGGTWLNGGLNIRNGGTYDISITQLDTVNCGGDIYIYKNGDGSTEYISNNFPILCGGDMVWGNAAASNDMSYALGSSAVDVVGNWEISNTYNTGNSNLNMGSSQWSIGGSGASTFNTGGNSFITPGSSRGTWIDEGTLIANKKLFSCFVLNATGKTVDFGYGLLCDTAYVTAGTLDLSNAADRVDSVYHLFKATGGTIKLQGDTMYCGGDFTGSTASAIEGDAVSVLAFSLDGARIGLFPGDTMPGRMDVRRCSIDSGGTINSLYTSVNGAKLTFQVGKCVSFIDTCAVGGASGSRDSLVSSSAGVRDSLRFGGKAVSWQHMYLKDQCTPDTGDTINVNDGTSISGGGNKCQ